MTKSLSRKIIELPPSGIRRFFEVASEIPDVISLGVGEPDFKTPWKVCQDGIQSMKEGKTHYTANAGLMELRQAICQYLQKKYQLTYDPKTETLVTVGASEAIDIACRALINPGDEVLCADPGYVSYVPSITMADGKAIPVALNPDEDFILDPETLEAAITEKTKALLINFPNNPTGAQMTKEQLKDIVDVILKHDLYVISDEIYSELNYRSEPVTSIASFEGMKERTIYINGFAKAFAMTGWRLGYVCAPPEISEQMLKIHQYAIMAAGTTSQYSAITALTECEEEVLEMKQAYRQRRDYLLTCFQKIGLPCFKPEGAFYCFPDIREFQMTSEAFALRLLDEEKLAVVPGTAFGQGGEGFIRISYAYSIQELEQAVEKLSAFVSRLRV